MTPNVYLIVSKRPEPLFTNAESVKCAICKYASYVGGLRIQNSLFEKVVEVLEIDEIVELFNNNCYSDDDKIEMIVTGFTTLYKRDGYTPDFCE